MEKNLFDRPEFQCLGKEKLEVLKEMAQKGKGKSPMEMMNLFSQYGQKLSSGKTLSQKEKNAMLLVAREGMSAEERKRMDQVMTMMQFMGN